MDIARAVANILERRFCAEILVDERIELPGNVFANRREQRGNFTALKSDEAGITLRENGFDCCQEYFLRMGEIRGFNRQVLVQKRFIRALQNMVCQGAI